MITNTPTGLSTADRDGGCNGRDALDAAGVNAGRKLGEGTSPVNLANVAIFPSVHGMME